MREKVFTFSAVVLFLLAAGSYGQDGPKDEVPPQGMEVIHVGKSKINVPKGTKVSKVAEVMTIESIEQYVSRRLEEIDGKIEKTVKRIDEVEKKIDNLEKKVDEVSEMLE